MVVVVVIVVVALLLVVGFVLARRGATQAQQRVEDHLAGATVLRREKAELRGVLGIDGPSRGLGLLALTPEELVFAQYVPDRAVRIARRAITAVTVARSLGEDTFAADVLVVGFTGDGGPAEAAWEVPDLDEWLAALGGSRPGTAP